MGEGGGCDGGLFPLGIVVWMPFGERERERERESQAQEQAHRHTGT